MTDFNINALILTHSNVEIDGRLNELIDIFNQISNVSIFQKSVNESYIKFMIRMLGYIKKNGSTFDLIVLDNTEVCLAFYIIKVFFNRFLNDPFIIKDFREFYLISDMRSIKEKIALKYEIKFYAKAHLCISANEERSKLMLETFDLKELPLVFENIRNLKNIESVDVSDVFDFKRKKFRIISTGGYNIERGAFELVKGFEKISDDNEFELLIVGDKKCTDFDIIRNYIQRENIHNIYLLDKVPFNKLKSIIDKCDVGIVQYSKKDFNNIYCASGKVYEYISLGKPIVTTSNITLKNLCDKYTIGIVDDEYYNGIIQIYEHYSLYQSKANELMKVIEKEDYSKNLSKRILEKYNEYNTKKTS